MEFNRNATEKTLSYAEKNNVLFKLKYPYVLCKRCGTSCLSLFKTLWLKNYFSRGVKVSQEKLLTHYQCVA